jgi:outer membrane lipase/esterase
MRQTKFVLALLAAAALAACGSNGSTGGPQVNKVQYSSMVAFGDSLSDVGSYAVGTVAQLGGGKYTINGDNTAKNAVLTGKNFTELLAAQFGLPAPCAAQTGLNGDATKGFKVAVVNHAGCLNYAQGGSRVTSPVGPGNILTGSSLGALTVPVVTQVANHLAASGGKFSGTEVVFVTAGGNDALELLGELSAAATAAGTAAGNTAGAAAGAAAFPGLLATGLAVNATNKPAAIAAIGAAIQAEAARAGSTSASIVNAAVGAAAIQPGNSGVVALAAGIAAKAQADAAAAGAAAGATAGAAAGAAYAATNGPKNVPLMAAAGTELANLIKTQIVGKGASYVVVNNLPDLGSTPASKAKDANTQALIIAMVSAFNTALQQGIAGESKILYVDLYAISHDQVTNPAPYGLTNTSTPACGANALGTTSLVCNGTNVIAGDVSHYMFADDVHPTPFEYALVAKYIAEQMIIKGWL